MKVPSVIKLCSFAMAVVLTLLMVGFCMYKLSSVGKTEDGDKALYISLLTSMISIWIPSPSSVFSAKRKTDTTSTTTTTSEIDDRSIAKGKTKIKCGSRSLANEYECEDVVGPHDRGEVLDNVQARESSTTTTTIDITEDGDA